MKIYSPEQIANFFIEKSFHDAEQNGELTPIKLLKLVYYAYGWHLAFFGKPLTNELIQAWQFGPVMESVYHATKYYGNTRIRKKIPGFAADFDPDVRGLLEEIWKVYKKSTGIELANATHLPGTPWKQIYDEEIQNYGQLRRGRDIPDALIEEHFKSLLKQVDTDEAAEA